MFLPDFENSNVLVIGDIILDTYVFGDVSRVSPEAPVPVLKFNTESSRLGGAANVANNITSLGSRCTLLGLVGPDKDGAAVLQLLKNSGIDYPLNLCEGYQTNRKTRYVSSTHQLLRLDSETIVSDTNLYTAILAFLTKHITRFTCIVISDYGKGVGSIARQIIDIARCHSIFTIVDPKSDDFSIYAGCDLITPNQNEFNRATSRYRPDLDFFKLGDLLLRDFNIHNLLVTQGPKGMSLLTRDSTNHISLPSHAQEVFDVTGAGDTVVATLAASYNSTFPILDSVKLSNLAASIAVRKSGTYAVTLSDLYLSLDFLTPYTEHSSSIQHITAVSRSLRDAGKRIAVTNGCFDILHPGHIRLLNYCRSLSDVVIVLLNSDSSVQALKGPSRPINDENYRKEVLLSLSSVDFVFTFSASTPLEHIQAIQPHFLVKGGDYKVSEVSGASFVEQTGGQCVIFSYIDGFSSSSVIQRISSQC